MARHEIPDWSVGGYDFLFLSVDAATGSSVTKAFGFGAATTDEDEENHNVYYSSLD